MNNVILSKGTKYFQMNEAGESGPKVEVVEPLKVGFLCWTPKVGVYEFNGEPIFVVAIDNPEQEQMMAIENDNQD